MVSSDVAGPSIAPCQQEAVTEQTSSSLYPTAVRVITERGDLKDRPQEVTETLLLPRKRLFASERHLCPQAIQKYAIKPTPHPDSCGSLVSGSPCIPQHAVFLFSFLQLNSLQIKSFRPLLLESVYAFILRARSRTLST
jgi:hypothetical protein